MVAFSSILAIRGTPASDPALATVWAAKLISHEERTVAVAEGLPDFPPDFPKPVYFRGVYLKTDVWTITPAAWFGGELGPHTLPRIEGE